MRKQSAAPTFLMPTEGLATRPRSPSASGDGPGDRPVSPFTPLQPADGEKDLRRSVDSEYSHMTAQLRVIEDNDQTILTLEKRTAISRRTHEEQMEELNAESAKVAAELEAVSAEYAKLEETLVDRERRYRSIAHELVQRKAQITSAFEDCIHPAPVTDAPGDKEEEPATPSSEEDSTGIETVPGPDATEADGSDLKPTTPVRGEECGTAADARDAAIDNTRKAERLSSLLRPWSADGDEARGRGKKPSTVSVGNEVGVKSSLESPRSSGEGARKSSTGGINNKSNRFAAAAQRSIHTICVTAQPTSKRREMQR